MQRRKDSKNRVLKEGEYERKNKTYEYKFTDRLGKRHSIYAKTLDELREKEIDILKGVLDGLRIHSKNLTINDFYKKWVNLKRGLKENTFQNYRYMYEMFVFNSIGTKKISDLKRTDIRAFYNALLDTKNIKIKTVECIQVVLHQVLELAVEDDYLRYNPSDNALKELKKAHNKDEERRKAMTLKEQKVFENYLAQEGPDHKWYPVFIVMLYTGMRVGEITGLTWQDIDFTDETISVNHTLVYFDKGGNGCGYAINTPKTEAGKRIIPMTKKVKDALIQEKNYQEEMGLKCKVTIDGYTNFVFINRFGTTHNQCTLNKALKRIVRDCNYQIIDKGECDSLILPKISNHSLRHTFTTRMVESGLNVKAIQEILGHTDVQTTMNIYADASKEFTKAELSILEKYLD